MGDDPGKRWFVKMESLLAAIDPADYVARVDEWFSFPAQKRLPLKGEGVGIFRTLIWTGLITSDSRVTPILTRIRNVSWHATAVERRLKRTLDWTVSRAKAPL